METQEQVIDIHIRSGHVGALSQVDYRLVLLQLGVWGHL